MTQPKPKTDNPTPQSNSRSEGQKRRRRELHRRRQLTTAQFIADYFPQDERLPRDPENLQSVYKPRTATGRTLVEEDELLDRLYRFGHKYAKDD